MKEGDIKTYSIAALAVLLVIAGLMLLSSYGKEKVAVNPGEVTDCSTITSSYLKDACYFELAVKDSNANTCTSVIDSDQKDLCYLKVALAKDDKTICKLISEKFYMAPKCSAEIDNLKTKQI